MATIKPAVYFKSFECRSFFDHTIYSICYAIFTVSFQPLLKINFQAVEQHIGFNDLVNPYQCKIGFRNMRLFHHMNNILIANGISKYNKSLIAIYNIAREPNSMSNTLPVVLIYKMCCDIRVMGLN